MDELNKKKKKKEMSFRREIILLNQRLDSHSRRINKFQQKLASIVSNQEHYLKKKLPNVLKREKARQSFIFELERARAILKGFGKEHFVALSNSKDIEKRNSRYIGMFTHIEMQKLRRLLEKIDQSQPKEKIVENAPTNANTRSPFVLLQDKNHGKAP